MATRQTPLEQAKHHEAKGDVNKALDAYSQHLATHPTDTRARLRVGELQEKQGKTEQALATFRAVAKLQAEQGFAAQAIAVLRRVLKGAPSDAPTALALSDLLFDSGKKRDAADVLIQAAQSVPGQDKDAAPHRVALLERAAKLDPTSLQVSLDLHEALVHCGRQAPADELLRACVERARGVPASAPHLRLLERLLEAAPGELKVAWEAARMALDLREPIRALRAVRVALDAHPDDAYLVGLAAEALELRGDTARALLLNREAARRWDREGHQGDAKDFWQKVLATSPSDAEARTALGMKLSGNAKNPLDVLQPGEVDSVLASLGESAPLRPSTPADDSRDFEVALDELPVLTLDVDPVPGGS